jgi:hypothetical protein
MAAAASPCSDWGTNVRILATGLCLRLIWFLDNCSPSDCSSSSCAQTRIQFIAFDLGSSIQDPSN